MEYKEKKRIIWECLALPKENYYIIFSIEKLSQIRFINAQQYK